MARFLANDLVPGSFSALHCWCDLLLIACEHLSRSFTPLLMPHEQIQDRSAPCSVTTLLKPCQELREAFALFCEIFAHAPQESRGQASALLLDTSAYAKNKEDYSRKRRHNPPAEAILLSLYMPSLLQAPPTTQSSSSPRMLSSQLHRVHESSPSKCLGLQSIRKSDSQSKKHESLLMGHPTEFKHQSPRIYVCEKRAQTGMNGLVNYASKGSADTHLKVATDVWIMHLYHPPR